MIWQNFEDVVLLNTTLFNPFFRAILLVLYYMGRAPSSLVKEEVAKLMAMGTLSNAQKYHLNRTLDFMVANGFVNEEDKATILFKKYSLTSEGLHHFKALESIGQSLLQENAKGQAYFQDRLTYKNLSAYIGGQISVQRSRHRVIRGIITDVWVNDEQVLEIVCGWMGKSIRETRLGTVWQEEYAQWMEGCYLPKCSFEKADNGRLIIESTFRNTKYILYLPNDESNIRKEDLRPKRT